MNEGGMVTTTCARPKDLKKRIQPDGMQFLSNGELAYWDVTRAHPTAPSHLPLARRPGKLLDVKEAGKISKYTASSAGTGKHTLRP
jgi:hypothetical protein